MELKSLTEKVLAGGTVTREEALFLYGQPLEALCQSADTIREKFCSNRFDICSIINAKSGRCSENCRFCAQSAHNNACAAEFPLRPADDVVAQAKRDFEQGVLRFSIVTSGRRLPAKEIDTLCDIVRRIRNEVGIEVCISVGLLTQEQFRRLKDAGVSRVHNNLETSRNNFPNICTTHTFDDKISAIKAAQTAGLPVCSGGIVGLGETVGDRIDMALSLRELGVKSVPVNMLNPIPGTPMEKNPLLSYEDMRRTVAVYRFILPGASIRLAGGRGLMADKGKACFRSGANATISGDMLTTAGITTETDIALIRELGYETGLCH